MENFNLDLGVKNVLLVTDDPWIRDSLTLFFAIEGCRLRTASNANEAVSAISDDRFDLILCDYWLPDMDGLSFLKLYGKHQRKAVVILISAYITRQEIDEARRSGVHDVIGRPFSIETLERSLRRHSLKDRRRETEGAGRQTRPPGAPVRDGRSMPRDWRPKHTA